MALSNAQWFANPGVVYEIDESCRFNSADSAYTGAASPTPTSERIFTFSFWFKRAKLGTRMNIWSNERDDGAGTLGEIQFQADDTIRWKSESAAGANIFDRQTNAVFRDPSAWYHIVCVCDSNQTDATSAAIYVNGFVQTYSSTTNPGSAQDLGWPSTGQPFEVGKFITSTHYLDGYLAHFYFIDGQKLTPSYFGETNSTTGQWVPKAYTGTFGNAGLFLDFSVAPGTGDGAGTDSSGNDNDLTDSGLAANDQMPDSPTDNYCTFNPLDRRIHTYDYVVLSNGNLDVTQSSVTGVSWVSATVPAASGKWFWEVTDGGSGYIHIGILTTAKSLSQGDTQMPGDNTQGWVYRYDGQKENGGTMTSYGDTFTADDVISVAWDADNGAIWFAKNGTWQASATQAEIEAGTTTNAAFSSGIAGIECRPIVAEDQGANTNSWVGNFGQHSFTATMPSGFSHLSTANLADPTIADPSAYFQTTLYTGDGSTQSVNQGGNSTFEPDLVWIKNRSAADNHCVFDSVRGATEVIFTNESDAQTTDADTLTAFDSDGFSLGDDDKVNTNTENFVAWQWLESNTSALDIVQYEGTGSKQTISHGLGVAPDLIIFKNIDSAQGWAVYHRPLGPEYEIRLSTNTAAIDDAAFYDDDNPTSSVFTVNTNSAVNGSGNTIIAYVFAEVEGFSKVGKYTGNGSTDGPFIFTGFKPRFLMTKRTNAAEEWTMRDSARSGGYFGSAAGTGGVDPTGGNGLQLNIAANLATEEEDNSGGSRLTDFLSNGFKLRHNNTAINADGSTYIWMAFAESPFKYATAR